MVQGLTFKQSGIALISVLLVFIILAWVSSYFMNVSEKQLQLMQLIKDRVIAEIEVDSSLDEMYFKHLSGEYQTSQQLANWNYQGIEFKPTENLTVKIKDTQGKLSLHSFDKGILRRLLENSNVDEQQVSHFIDCVDDWEDADSLKRIHGGEADYYLSVDKMLPRNGKLQTVSELANVCGFPQSAAGLLYDNVLLRGHGSFSPMYASNELIRASYLADDRKELLINLKQQKNTTKINDVFNQNASDIGAYQYSLSSTIEFDVSYTKGQAVARRNVVISHRLGYKPRPIIQYWHWSE